MVVEWTTRDATTPMVMYGTTNGSLTNMVSAASKTYNASSFCGSPVSGHSTSNSLRHTCLVVCHFSEGTYAGMLHTAALNLSYNTEYCHQYSTGDMVSLST